MKKLLPIITALLLLASIALVAIPRQAMAAGDYDYYRSITLESDEVTSTLSNIPIVIDETIAELKTTANGGHIENIASGGASGSVTVPADFDIGTNNDCSSGLSFEVEYYDAATGELTVWVKIPSLSHSEDTIIYFCYGDSGTTTSQENVTDVWSNDYAAVWHLAETSGTFYDSTANSNDGTDYVGNTGKTGIIGPGQDFDGTDDYIQIPASQGGSIDNLDNIHISAWVYLDTVTDEMVIDRYYGSTNDLQLWSGTGTMTWRSATQTLTEQPVSATTWTYFNGNFNGTTWRLYKNDGAPDTDTATDAASATDEDWWIAVDTDAADGGSKGNYLDGRLDEIRISSSNRSADWIEAEYNNITSGTFVTVGTEQETVTPTNTPTETITPTATPAVILGDSSIYIDEGLEAAIATAVNDYRPDGLTATPHADMFVITNYNESDTDYYYWVSVAGIDTTGTPTPDTWDMIDDSVVWSGLGIAYENPTGTYEAYIEGSEDYDTMLDAAGLEDIASPSEGGTGSYYYTFPWAAGYTAYYGMLGVHGGSNDAVDWVGGTTRYSDSVFPNGVYVSQGGDISWVCKDDTQVAVRIGQFTYYHLVDNSTLNEGVYHPQGSYLGALITGTHLTPKTAWKGCPASNPNCVDSLCGYTEQHDTSYHLHWVLNTAEDYFRVEDWVLHRASGIWSNGSAQVGPGQYMFAQWGDRPLVPTPGPTVTPGGPTVTPAAYSIPIYQNTGGGQIWDGLIGFAESRAYDTVEEITDTYAPLSDSQSQERELVPLALSGARIAIRSLYVILRSNLNLTITMLVLTIIFIAEPIRALRAIWMAIKDMIPFVG